MNTSTLDHTSLLFRSESLSTWRQRLAAGPRSQVHLAHASAICRDLCDPQSDHYFDFRERKDPAIWQSRKGNFEIPAHILTLALTGHAADESTWVSTARDALMTLIDERLAIDGLGDYTGWSGGRWPFHDAGKYYHMLGITYDLTKHLMDAAQLQRVHDHVRELYAIAMQERMLRQAYMENNQGARYMLGLLMMELAFKDDMDNPFTTILSRAGHWVEKAIRLNVGRDGGPREGHSYGCSALLFYAVTADILARSGGDDITRDRRLRGFADYCLYEMIYSHGFVNPISDSSHMDMGQMVYFAAMRYRDPAHLWLWDQFNGDDSHAYSTLRGMREAPNVFYVPWVLLWPDDDAVTPRSPEGVKPKWAHFRERGIVSVRSGFDAASMHVTLHAGPNPQHWHSQADQNNVTLHALGRRWIIDPGYHYRDNDGQQRIARYSDAHNNVHIDTIGQTSKDSPEGYPRGDMVSAEENAGCVTVIGDATEAYPASLKVIKAQRTLRIALDGSGLTWLDDYQVEDDAEHDYELTLHADEGLTFEPGGKDRYILREGDKRVTFAFSGTGALSYRDGKYAQHTTLHIAQRAAGAVRFEVEVVIANGGCN